MICYGVITEVPEAETGHNMATAFPLYQRASTDPTKLEVEVVSGELGMLVLTQFLEPVFVLSEIMILDDPWGREIAGAGRKPSKWGVKCETFPTIHEAIERAKEVRTW